MLSRVGKICFVIGTVLSVAACSDSRQAEAPKSESVYFPGSVVCTYPSASPAKTFTRLGGGNWASSAPGTAGALFECVGANNTVQLINTGGLIEVDYYVSGAEPGATMITLNYAASATQPLTNESTYRNVFANLTEVISKQGLGTTPPELFRKKLSNLNSYSKPGAGGDEIFDVGSGFVALSREASADKLNINISVKYYSDVNLKLAK